MHVFTTRSTGPDDTRRLAASVGVRLVAGDVILLKGGLAAGKTLFVAALAQAMGAVDPVTSPTFGLVHIYPLAKGSLVHVDTYRLDSLAEYRDLGLDELTEDGVLAVEWGALVEADYPQALTIEITPVDADGQGRDIRLTSPAARWGPVLDALAGKTA